MENKECLSQSDYVTLKEYVDTRMDATEKQTELTRYVLEKQTELTRINLEGRLSSMNEFRAQLTDQASTFITRREHDILAEKIDKMESKMDLQEGKASQSSVFWAYGLSAVGILLGVISALEKAFIK